MRVREVMTTAVRTVLQEQETGLQDLLASLNSFRHIPVVDAQGGVVGMLSRLDLLQAASRWGWRKSVRVAELASGPAVSIAQDATVEDAIERMRRAHVHALPVLGRGRALAGIVTDTDLLACLAGAARTAARGLEDTPVERAMTSPAVTIEETAPLADAAEALLRGSFRHIPVTDADGRLTGMLSERDLRARFGTDLRSFGRATYEARTELVSEAMTPDPISIPVTARLADALAVFADDRVGALPVVDADGRVAGIVSYVDLLAALRERPGAAAARRSAARRAARRARVRRRSRRRPRRSSA